MSRLLALEGGHDRGLAHAKRAHQLNPYHADIIMNYGLALMRSGQTNEGLEKLERALAINPYAPTYYKSHLSLGYFLAGRPADGLEILKSVEGRVGPSRIARIANLTALGRVEEAQVEAQIVLHEDPSFDLEHLIAGYALKSQEDRALLADALVRAGLPE
jgi:tetratricopeptide (TPR) repeat protein